MQIDDRVELLAPIGTKFISIQQSLGLQPFAEEVLAFLADLSQMLRADPRVRALPDLYSFGFWCRRTSLEKMRREYPRMDCRLGRGLVFHVGPSNVPVNFAYSLVAGLLAGNANIVRVPSADFLQVRILAQILNELLCNPLYISLREYIRLVRYSRNAEDITAIFSNICDVRVIWGGDSTINNIRQQHLPARAFDVTFAGTHSSGTFFSNRFVWKNSDPHTTISFGVMSNSAAS